MAKKSHNAINIISFISVMGVTVGTMALIVILSVFNGFDDLVRSLINSFNPDLKIVLVEGKTFHPDSATLNKLRALPGVFDMSMILEDKALVRYDEQQTIAVVKGVDDNYVNITGLDSMIVEGEYALQRNNEPSALIGRGIRIYLNVMLLSPRQISLYVPRRTADVSVDPSRALNRKYLSVSGVFSVEQDFDLRYILVPVDFARELFGYSNGEMNLIEIKLAEGANLSVVQEKVREIMGSEYSVLNRYQQNEVFYKTMQAEKWAIFLILFFILVVASFNVIGTLTMLIIEKKNDIQTLRYMGSNMNTIKRTFLLEGLMISFIGAIAGLILGSGICLIQQEFGIVKLQGAEAFVIDSYPVKIMLRDILLVLAIVSGIGFMASWYPIRFITRRYISPEN